MGLWRSLAWQALDFPLGIVVSVHDLGAQTPAVYPVASLPIALVVLLAITVVVIRAPLRRATRIRSGSALRYQ
jgi:hypothetical protein